MGAEAARVEAVKVWRIWRSSGKAMVAALETVTVLVLGVIAGGAA